MTDELVDGGGVEGDKAEVAGGRPVALVSDEVAGRLPPPLVPAEVESGLMVTLVPGGHGCSSRFGSGRKPWN